MRILLVDDERYALRNIERMIRESSLEVTEILTATDAPAAREILLASPVDLMICDIEMPRESGLDLLVWVQDKVPGLKSIVLTCHANFDYIRRAMRLKVEDYLIKPVPPEELIAGIRKAMETSAIQRETERNASLGKYWRENTVNILENFWTSILNGMIPSDEKSIIDEAEKRHISVNLYRQYVPILFKTSQRLEKDSIQANTNLRNAVSDILRNSFSSISSERFVLVMDPETYVCVLCMPEKANWMQIRSLILEDCEQIVTTAETFLSSRLYCYLDGRKTYQLMDLMEARLILNSFAHEDVVKRDRVRLIHDDEPLMGISDMPNLNILAVLLIEGSYGRAKQELIDLLDQKDATHPFLLQFYQSFVQMFASVLEHHNKTFDQIAVDMSSQVSIETLQDLQEYLLKLIDNLSRSKGQLTAVAEVTQYIDNHLDAKLSREQLAGLVYLSPDHLNRIFKQEHGVSIYEYIVNKRIALAADMLENTDLKLNAIALNIGYNNFSQFSKAFKDRYGMNPRDYRNRKKRNQGKI